MTDRGFFIRRRLSEALAEILGKEQRIIAEAPGAAIITQYYAAALPGYGELAPETT